MLQKFAFTVVFITIVFVTVAQKILYTAPNIQATPAPVSADATSAMFFLDMTQSKERAIVYTADGTVALYKEFKKDGALLIKLNNDGKQGWKTAIKDEVFYVGLYNSHLLVLTVPEWNHDIDNNVRSIKAVQLDPANGKMVSEKEIFKTDADVFLEPKALSAGYEFKGLLIRYSESKKKNYHFAADAYEKKSASSRIDCLNFDDQLNLTSSRTLASTIIGMEFIGCLMNKNSELFIVGATNNVIVVEKFNSKGISPVSKIATHYEVREKTLKQGVLKINPENPDQLVVSFRCNVNKKDYTVSSTMFDFSAGKGYNHTAVYDKQYTASTGVGYVDDIYATAIQFYKDRTIVCKEVRTSVISGYASRPRYYSLQLIISVYDKNMKVVKEFIIPRSYETFIPRQMFAGYHVDTNRLLVLFNNNGGSAAYETRLAIIDLEALNLISNNVLERGTVDKESVIEAKAVLWLPGKMVLPYIVESKGFSKEETTVLQVVEIK